MRKLVGEREHLRRLGVRAVDEDQRRERVAQGEAAKLGGVEAAVVVAHHDPADHDEHAGGVGLADEEPQGIGPCRARAAGGQIEAERLRASGPRRSPAASRPWRCRRSAFRLLRDPDEVSVPALPFLAGIDRVQKVRARLPHGPPGNSAEVRDGNGFLGRLGEEQVADRHMDGMGERLHLLQGGLRLAVLPFRQFLEPGRKRLLRAPCALTRPADQRGIDGHARHATASTTLSASRMRMSPDMSLGRSVSRRAARAGLAGVRTGLCKERSDQFPEALGDCLRRRDQREVGQSFRRHTLTTAGSSHILDREFAKY